MYIPQFDYNVFAPQVFWTVFLFFLLFILLYFSIVRIRSSLMKNKKFLHRKELLRKELIESKEFLQRKYDGFLCERRTCLQGEALTLTADLGILLRKNYKSVHDKSVKKCDQFCDKLCVSIRDMEYVDSVVREIQQKVVDSVFVSKNSGVDRE